ncbi:MAG: hypothetical protein Barrevirus12_4 [Barrevirus sp.]|uniref:Uncharacterized protein n=1 Tax=Barrevirus sp. TaxID=2487763 RepID=A0A3G4ZQD8_9VIRU|nr:MAG: hypothetical protein Barrevirus12_4 [Barrevirus sp.]
MYTILGIILGGTAGALVPTKGSHASLTSVFWILGGALLGGVLGFGYGAGKLASGTHFLTRFFKKD